MKYLTKATYEKNANNGLTLHDTLADAESEIEDILAGYGSARLFEVHEVEFLVTTRISVAITGRKA